MQRDKRRYSELFSSDFARVNEALQGKDPVTVQKEAFAIEVSKAKNTRPEDEYTWISNGIDLGWLGEYQGWGRSIKGLPRSGNLILDKAHPILKIGKNISHFNTKLNENINTKRQLPKEIYKKNGYYYADGMIISESYYDKLWKNGRKAPFIQAREIINSNPIITQDERGKVGFYRYEANDLEMIFNPQTKEIWHIQPIKRK